MKVLSIANEKGGVGKSSAVLGIGSYLQKQGKKVLFVDCDPTRTLSKVFALDDKPVKHLDDVIRGDAKITEAIAHTPCGDVIPCTMDMSKYETLAKSTFAKKYGTSMVLKKALEPIIKSGAYDCIILDAPPTMGQLQLNVLCASDWVMIPTLAEALAVDSVSDMVDVIQAVQSKSNPNLKIMGILLNRYNKRATLSSMCKDELLEVANRARTWVWETPIRNCISISEAMWTQNPSIFEYAPKSHAAKDYEALGKEFEKSL